MEFNCVKCGVVDKICRVPDGRGPDFYPTKTKTEIIEKAMEKY
jgi:hypothetical protein